MLSHVVQYVHMVIALKAMDVLARMLFVGKRIRVMGRVIALKTPAEEMEQRSLVMQTVVNVMQTYNLDK